jgi:hypothetical protein
MSTVKNRVSMTQKIIQFRLASSLNSRNPTVAVVVVLFAVAYEVFF